MKPSIFLMNGNGEIWDLRPAPGYDKNHASYFGTLDGTGFETKLSFTRVSNDFVQTDEDAQQIDIEGTFQFKTHTALDNFGTFTGNFEGELKFYYDPTGKYKSTDTDISAVWYKTVRITKFSAAEEDKDHSCWKVKAAFTPTSANWKKDVTTASTINGVGDELHVYDYWYGFYYSDKGQVVGYIDNTGGRIGCEISIYNDGDTVITGLSWILTCGSYTEYASWDVSLQPGSTLIIDSNPLTQRAVVESTNELGVVTDLDVSDSQEPNPSYINFVDILPGENRIAFMTDSPNVIITIAFTEQTRAL